MPIRSGRLQPLATNHSAAAMKSSKTFCLFFRRPASCHALPYSPPPRRLAEAKTPPISSHGMTHVRYRGTRGASKPP